MRLPTEQEWETACNILQPKPFPAANFADNGNYHPHNANDKNLQFYGDCWEWTGSAYLPYPYYMQQEGALGEYNGKFMINQWYLGEARVLPIAATYAPHTAISFTRTCNGNLQE